jgi:hypothetical protein
VTDAQFAAVITLTASAGGSLIAALRWAVTRITTALDRNTSASLTHAREMSKLSTKIDVVFDWVGDHTPVHGVPIVEVDDFETATRPRGTAAPTPPAPPPAPPPLSPTAYQQRLAPRRKP